MTQVHEEFCKLSLQLQFISRVRPKDDTEIRKPEFE